MLRDLQGVINLDAEVDYLPREIRRALARREMGRRGLMEVHGLDDWAPVWRYVADEHLAALESALVAAEANPAGTDPATLAQIIGVTLLDTRERMLASRLPDDGQAEPPAGNWQDAARQRSERRTRAEAGPAQDAALAAVNRLLQGLAE